MENLKINGAWFTVASRNMLNDNNLSCRRENFALTGSSLNWATTEEL